MYGRRDTHETIPSTASFLQFGSPRARILFCGVCVGQNNRRRIVWRLVGWSCRGRSGAFRLPSTTGLGRTTECHSNLAEPRPKSRRMDGETANHQPTVVKPCLRGFSYVTTVVRDDTLKWMSRRSALFSKKILGVILPAGDLRWSIVDLNGLEPHRITNAVSQGYLPVSSYE